MSKTKVTVVAVWLTTIVAIFTLTDQQTRRMWYFTLRGDSLITSVTTVQMGTMAPNAIRTAKLAIRNTTSKPIDIIGCKNACSCAVVTKLPITIDACKTLSMLVEASTIKRSESIDESIMMYTNPQPSVTRSFLSR